MKTTTSLALLLVLFATSAAAQSPFDGLSVGDLADGERLFRVHCARCHGMAGEGGEGSSLVRSRLKHAPDDQALIDLLGEGIPGTGMPALWTLDEKQRTRVAAYVRSLGRLEPEEMPGDPVRGGEIYRGAGGCPACHIVAGAGNGIGPELTFIGDQRGREYLRASLTAPTDAQPETAGFKDYLTVRLRSADQSIEGVRVNEDAFTIQVRDVSGAIHSFRKDELQAFDKVFGHSLMPGYGTVLGGKDLDDVVSYLMSLKE
jgi:cytochrome c oxidase cbb3-type subunit 3